MKNYIPPTEDELIQRELYKRIYDLFNDFSGTLEELCRKYGMEIRDLIYKSDLSDLLMDVVSGTKTREEAKEWLKGFVATAHNLYVMKQHENLSRK